MHFAYICVYVGGDGGSVEFKNPIVLIWQNKKYKQNKFI